MRQKETLTFERFIELYIRENLSLAEIGERYGFSRQRVHQIKKQLEQKHGKIQRKSPLDSFALKQKLEEGLSVQEIANQTHLTPSKVNRLIRQYEHDYRTGISPVKIVRKTSRDILPKGLLHQLYAVQLLNDKEIGAMYNLSAASVWLLRKEYNIASIHSKKLRKLPQRLSKERFSRHYNEEGLSLQQLADMYACHLTSIAKLKKQYGF